MKNSRAAFFCIRRCLSLACAATVLCFSPAIAQESISKASAATGKSSAKDDYRLGDRLPQKKSAAKAAAVRQITWEELVPKDWDPRKIFKDINLDQMSDADPRAMEALEKLRDAWNNAPVDSSLNGARVRIPGFLIPVESQQQEITEFLLVPYFGACIHTPPPPANQIIHVVSSKPVKGRQMMDAIWVSGSLETVVTDTEFGNSGYRMKAENITTYKK